MAEAKRDVRVWLDWNQGALATALDWLWQLGRRGRKWDLSGVLVVTAALRSRNRLLELLIARAEAERVDLLPPGFVPLGQLPERLYRPQHPLASELAQQLAWVQALREIDPQSLQLLVKIVPPVSRWMDWLPLASLLQKLHVDLASEALDFADVLGVLMTLGVEPDELTRWGVLHRAQRAYYNQLSGQGLWDRQAARLKAIEQRECRTERDIVLVGVADLGRVFRQMLQQVIPRVTSFVFADPSVHEGFDDLGCLRSEFWQDHPLDLPADRLRIVDRPADQASEVLEVLASLQGKVPAARIAVGVPDRSVVPHLRRALDLAGVATHNAAGYPLRQTLPFRLMQAALEYLRWPQFAAFGQLVRHPDCFDWLSDQTASRCWLGQLDEYQSKFIPLEIGPFGEWNPRAGEELQKVFRVVKEWLEPVSGSPRSPGEWVEPWRQILLAVYGHMVTDDASSEGRQTLAACGSLAEALADLEALPRDGFACGAAEALQLALDPLVDETVAEPSCPNAVDLLGWLDLSLDDSAVTVVTGFNDEFVPSSESAHLFLPNSLRTELGIFDNQRRYARDAYWLALLTHSPRELTVISGRRSDDGDPLLPSRLLFATDDTTMVTRATSFFGHRPPATSRLWLAPSKHLPLRQQFRIPRPADADTVVSELSATDFKQYLVCPYRFYLQRVLKLEEVADDLAELPAFAFGHLIHDVVQAFGGDRIKDTTDPDEIRSFFRSRLARELAGFGNNAAPAVRIQFAQAQLRLDRLADLQAQRRNQGWVIEEVETRLSATLVVDGQPFSIHGRVDRIDRHEQSGALAVFDYKTRNTAEPPEKTHRLRGEWVDLQLPIYRRMVLSQPRYNGRAVDLGYILMPADVQATEFALAEWNAEDLHAAELAASDVVRKIRRREFWPPIDPPPDYSESYAAICQDNVSERWRPAEVSP